LQTTRNEKDVQRLVVAFHQLQDHLQTLALHTAIEPELVREQIERLSQDRQQIEKALNEKRDREAWGILNTAWFRFVQLLPDDKLPLLLSRRIEFQHMGTGTQTLAGWFDALREEAAINVSLPTINRQALHSYVLILEQARCEIEQALSEGKYDRAWFILRGLWERRLAVLPPEQLETERQALEVLVPSVGRGKRREKLEKALAEAKGWDQDPETLPQLRSLLIWVKREINETAQARYWRFNIYRRRVEKTSVLLFVFLLSLSVAGVILGGLQDGDWIHHTALIAGVLLAGALGGAVSGLRSSAEISQPRLSSAYFKQAVTYLRMLVGAAAALVVYFLLASGLLAVSFAPGVQDLAYIGLGFVAGFSEQFFLQSLDKVGGSEVMPPAPQSTIPASAEEPGAETEKEDKP
jgi:hypothetical protein